MNPAPPTWLVPALVATTAASLLAAALYLHLYTSRNRDRLLALWGAAWGIYSLRFVIHLALVLGLVPPWLNVAQQAVSVAGGVLSVYGANALADRPASRWWGRGAWLCTAWAVGAEVGRLPFFWADLPVSLFVGLAFAWAGLTVLRDAPVAGAGKGVAGYSLILWGLHKADYPFLRPVAWFAPWGFLGAAVLFLATAFGILLLYFDRLRQGLEGEMQEREQAEAALRENEVLLNEVGCLAQVGGWEMDLVTGKARWTRGTYDVIGIGYGDSIPGPDEHLSYYLPEYRPVVATALQGLIAEDIPFDFEAQFRTVQGSIRWCRVQGKAVRENGVCVKVYGALQDITERKKAEQEIRELNATLEQRVAERTAQLEAANQELEAFAYSVSHDLRAPLRAVDGYTRILLEDYGVHLDAEGKRVCGVISASAVAMGKLIDDLLAFSRIGRTTLAPSPVDMEGLARAIFFEVTTAADRERIEFRLGPLPPARGDPTLLRQVWMNLVSNAVKFSAKQERAVIEVGAEPRGDEVFYTIRDDGAGFDMQYAAKLFGVFQRLHSTREFEGTGVGLAIVQRILHRHGGRIWAEGETGRGATFHFAVGKGA